MKTIIRNFVPQDTRIIEIASGVSLFFMSLAFFLKFNHDFIIGESPAAIWGSIAILISLVQLASLAWHPNQLYARIASLWASGSFFVFFALNTQSTVFETIVMFVLGISCYAAFIINTIIVSEFAEIKERRKELQWKR